MNVSIGVRQTDQYREVENDQEILSYLELPTNKSLSETLKESGYLPFINLTTTRKKYKKDGFGIDLDSVDFGYKIAELV